MNRPGKEGWKDTREGGRRHANEKKTKQMRGRITDAWKERQETKEIKGGRK